MFYKKWLDLKLDPFTMEVTAPATVLIQMPITSQSCLKLDCGGGLPSGQRARLMIFNSA